MTLTLLAGTAGCSSDGDRPADADWVRRWEEARQLIPDAQTIIDGGSEFCDELNGRLRVELPELLPSPSESLDEAVSQWVAQAEDISFECPRDQSVLTSRLTTLETLAAEVDGGLETLND